jgi:hypothetical protein
MNMIFKYKLENIDQQTIVMPFPARILSVTEQNNDIVLYSIVDDEKDVPTIPVDILIKGTVDVVENEGLYTFLGTVKLPDGETWHVFYRYTDHVRIVDQPDKLGESLTEEFKGGMKIIQR